MKKYLLLLIICFCSLSTWAAVVEDEVTAKVSGTSINVALTNSISYVAFQMDIKLPSGVSIAENGVAPVTARLSQDNGGKAEGVIGNPKFIVAYNQIDATNNIYRIIAYNLNNAAIAGTSGDDVLNITLSAAATSSNVELSGVIFVDENLFGLDNLDTSVVDGYKMGDVNHDNLVNVDDLTAVVRYICGKNPSPFYVEQANVATSSSAINVDDLTAIINIIKQSK